MIEASGPRVEHVPGDRAYYRIAEDKVVLPEPSQFPTRNGYYQTALHECGHSTGHPDRMDRDTLKEGLDKGFGSPEYAREELRAEISAITSLMNPPTFLGVQRHLLITLQSVYYRRNTVP